MFLKKRLVAFVVGVSLMIAVIGASGVVADSLGFDFTPQAHACENSGGGGGSC